MKPLYLLLLLLWAAEYACAQKQDTIYRFFKGAVNKEYSITMELKQIGSRLEGNYFYDKYRKNVAVKGELRADGLIVLQEIDPSGNKTSSTFVGTHQMNWKSIEGTWENKTKDRYFTFDLMAIEQPLGQKRRYSFDNIRWFQGLLNYFDLEPELPFTVYQGIEKNNFRWKNDTKESARKDYQKMIPYRLAKRFIMDQVRFKPEGSFDYFDISADQYKLHAMHYKALCTVYKTSSYVGLLLNFEEDTGWDTYNVTFLLIYDYAGHLLDACKVGKRLNLEHRGKQLKEQMTSKFLVDSTIEMHATCQRIEYGNNSIEEEYYKEQQEQRYIYYILQPSGRFIRQEVDLGKKRKR
ncbi:hypothetical protein [Aureispira anguillae]|uniref:Uncharacterized protein n=1 Tax=Aureispira anguillae TaxID=2864201 RepID=A0A915VKM9_9BACT|nr:hypothetical protein [Aureispira anguillae]BDS09740.1 hypothetical protein AsAng_0004450 [Aureispira anguillae]